MLAGGFCGDDDGGGKMTELAFVNCHQMMSIHISSAGGLELIFSPHDCEGRVLVVLIAENRGWNDKMGLNSS